MALGVVVAGVAVVVVAVATGATNEGEATVPAVPGDLLRTVTDAGSFALMTMGLALLVALFILQFGSIGPPQRRDPRRTARLAVLALGLLLLAPPLFGVIGDWLEGREQVLEEDRPEGVPPPVGSVGSAATDGGGQGGVVTGVVLGLVVSAAAAAWLWSGSQRHPVEREADELADLAEARGRLHLLLDEAIAALRDHPDPREAVIAAWSRLEVAFAAAGVARHEAEAPRPYVERALGAVETSVPVARQLAVTFERAMFSPHPITPAIQAEAIDALVAVRDDLALGSST